MAAEDAANMVAVGHHDLGGRGFNADVWVHERYAYVGSWGFSDWAQGSKERFCPNDGVAVVKTLDPARPHHVADLESPPGTSAEDVVVFTAEHGLLAGRDIAVVGTRCAGATAGTSGSSAGCRCST